MTTKQVPPTFLYGRFHFADQFRQAVIKRGTKWIHLVFISDMGLRVRTASLQELRYLREEANSQDSLKKLKKEVRKFMRKSPLTGAKREMTKKARGVLQEILNL